MEAIRAALLAGTFAALLSAVPAAPPKELLGPDFRGYAELRAPTIKVANISARRYFITNVTREEFEKFVQLDGADSVLVIDSQGLARKILRDLAAAKFKPGGNPQHVDVRHRVVIMDGESLWATLYVGAFGEVIHGDRVWLDTDKRNWFARMWRFVESDTFPGRQAPRVR